MSDLTCPSCSTSLLLRVASFLQPLAIERTAGGQWVTDAEIREVSMWVCPTCQRATEGQIAASPDEQDLNDLSDDELDAFIQSLLEEDDLLDAEDAGDADIDDLNQVKEGQVNLDEKDQDDEDDAQRLSQPTDVRHPGHPDQKVHGKWTKTDPHDKPLPASSKSTAAPSKPASSSKASASSSSSSSSMMATSGKKKGKGPKLSKEQRLERSMQSKIKQYERLAHRKLSKKWTAADQQMAQKIANDLQSVLSALKKGHAAGMAQVKSLLADAEKLHDAAPKSMSAHRITALQHLLARMNKIAGPSRVAMPQLMRWQDNCGCPICSINANQVRVQGEAYPSGHKVPAAHSGCSCELHPVEGEA